MINFHILNTDFVFVILIITNVCSYFAEVEADPLPDVRRNYDFAERSRKDIDSDHKRGAITKVGTPFDDKERNIGEETVDLSHKSEEDGRSLNFDMGVKGGDHEGLYATETGLNDNDGKDSVLHLPPKTGNAGVDDSRFPVASGDRKTSIRKNQGLDRHGEGLNRTVEGINNVPVPEVGENYDETGNSDAKVSLAHKIDNNTGVAQLSSENEKAAKSNYEIMNGGLHGEKIHNKPMVFPKNGVSQADSEKRVMQTEGSNGNNKGLHGNNEILNKGAHDVENKKYGDIGTKKNEDQGANTDDQNSNVYDRNFGTGERAHDSDDTPNDPKFYSEVKTKGSNGNIVSGDNVVSNGKDLHKNGKSVNSNEKDLPNEGDKDASPLKTAKQNNLNAVGNANHEGVNDDSPDVHNVGDGERGHEIPFPSSDYDKKGVLDPIEGKGEAVNDNKENVNVDKENADFLKTADKDVENANSPLIIENGRRKVYASPKSGTNDNGNESYQSENGQKEGHDVDESGNLPSKSGRFNHMEDVNSAKNHEEAEKSLYNQEKETRNKDVASPEIANSPNEGADSFLTNASDSKNDIVNPANSDKETINEERLAVDNNSLHTKNAESQKTIVNDKKDAESPSESGLKSDKDVVNPMNIEKQAANSDTLNAEERGSSQLQKGNNIAVIQTAASNDHKSGGVDPSKDENNVDKEGNIVAESENDYKEPVKVNAEHLNEVDKDTKVGNEGLRRPGSEDDKGFVSIKPTIDKESGMESPVSFKDRGYENVVNSSNSNGKSIAGSSQKDFHANENNKIVHEPQDRIKEEKGTLMDNKGDLHSKVGNENVESVVSSEKSDNDKHQQGNDDKGKIPLKPNEDDDDKKAAELSLKKEGDGDQIAREDSKIAANGTNVNEVIKNRNQVQSHNDKNEKTDGFANSVDANSVDEKKFVNESSQAHSEELAAEITSGDEARDHQLGNGKQFSIGEAGTGGAVTIKASIVFVLISLMINSKRN